MEKITEVTRDGLLNDLYELGPQLSQRELKAFQIVGTWIKNNGHHFENTDGDKLTHGSASNVLETFAQFTSHLVTMNEQMNKTM